MRFLAGIFLFGLPCERHVLTEAGPAYERCTDLVETCHEVRTVTERPNRVRNVKTDVDCVVTARYAATCAGGYPR